MNELSPGCSTLMSQTPEDEPLDAYSARLYRKPMPAGAIVDLILLQKSDLTHPIDTCPAAETLRKKGRLGQVFQVGGDAGTNLGNRLTKIITEMQSPLFIVSDASASWNKDILERLLKAIDSADMAIGSRQAASRVQRWQQNATAMRRGLFWGAGVKDPHSPYRIFRTEVFRKFPLQSSGRFIDIELVAKANFLDAMIFEENLPFADTWPGEMKYNHLRKDINQLFKKPCFQFQA